MAPMLLLGWTTSKKILEQSEASLLNEAKTLMAQIALLTSKYINSAKADATLFSKNELITKYLAISDENLRFGLYQSGILRLFKGYHQAKPHYYEIRLLLPDGYEDTRFAIDSIKNISDDESESDIFKKLSNNSLGIFENFYLNPDNNAIALMTGRSIMIKALAEEGFTSSISLRGYLLITSDTSIFKKQVQVALRGKHHSFFFTDNYNRILFHHDEAMTNQLTPKWLSEALAKANDSTPLYITAQEHDFLVYRKQITPYLYLNAAIPNKILIEQKQGLLIIAIIITATSTLIAILITYISIRKILLKPIEKLSNAITSIGSGDLTTLVETPSGDELGTLAQTFNEMTTKLKSTTVSRDYVDNILNSMADTLIVTSPDGIIRNINRATESLLEYDTKELVGQPLLKILYNPNPDNSNQDSQNQTMRDLPAFELLHSLTHSEVEAFYITKSDNKIPMIITGSLMWDHQQQIRGFVCVGHNLTERRRYEKALKQAKEAAEIANQAKSTFLSRMSHELRTPLNAIIGFAQIQQLRMTNQESKGLKSSTENILKAGQHLLTLINDILDMVKLEQHKLRIELTPCQLQPIITESVQLAEPQCHSNQVTINAECTDAWVQADCLRLKQVLINLLSNAIKYNRKNGVVTIKTVEVDSSCIQLWVEDTGIGINEKEIEQLFEPFTRLQYAESSEIQGTGIGLALSKHLVNEMQGSIGVESKVGQGSRFWIGLQKAQPISSKEVASPKLKTANLNNTTPDSEQNYQNNKTKVLYIEDNQASRELIQTFMDGLDQIEYHSSVNAEEGINKANQLFPDVILMDINLPKMKGTDAIAVLKSNPALQNTKMIALSADALPDQIDRAIKAGFDAYLTKPVDMKQIKVQLEIAH